VPDGPIRCPACHATDFFVVSTGVTYAGATLIETYRWPEPGESGDEHVLDEVFQANHIHDGGYEVSQQHLVEPEIQSIEGPVKALCASCLGDVTEQYLQLGRASASLPV
jgi:hypothetical protein